MEHSRRTWGGETGLLTGQTLTKYLESVHGPIYYIAGPPAMVAALRTMLGTAGVDEDDIRTEEFAGY
jgi:Na+-transporting NADH:ubiquinone oxidoreductase subunit NqrF